HDHHGGLLIVVLRAHAGAKQSDAAARKDAFFNSRAGRVHRVIDAILALLHLDLGCTTYADHRDAARELGEALLQFLLIVVRGGFLDLRFDLRNTRFDLGLFARAVDNRGVLLLDYHLLGATEHVHSNLVEFDAKILPDRLSASQDSDVFEHGLATIAEARSLHRRNLETAAQLVDDECGKRLALNVLGHDDERLRGLHYGFQQRKQFLQAGKLLLVDQDVGVIHLSAHLFSIGDEVRRDVTAIELHTFTNFEFCLQGFRFFDRDHALVADFLHRIREKLPDLSIAIGGNRADLSDLFVGGDILRVLLQIRNHRFDREVDAAFEIHRVHARGHGLRAFLHDRLGQNRCGCGAVTGEIG